MNKNGFCHKFWFWRNSRFNQRIIKVRSMTKIHKAMSVTSKGLPSPGFRFCHKMSKCEILLVRLHLSVALFFGYLFSFWLLVGGKKTHSGICLTHLQGLSVSQILATLYLGSQIPHHLVLNRLPLRRHSLLVPSHLQDFAYVASASNILHTLCLPSGLRSGVTSSKQPSWISPGPGCVLPQHSALPVYLGNSQQ